MSKNTLKYVRAGIIGALYVVLSLITLPIASGAIQLRVAEGLTLLPLIFPESIPALFIGCLLFNFISALPIYDVLLGSLITLVASVLTYIVGKLIKNKALKVFVGGLFPVLLNAIFLPIIWLAFTGELSYVYGLSVLFIFLGQVVSVYTVGTITYVTIDRLRDKKLKFLE